MAEDLINKPNHYLKHSVLVEPRVLVERMDFSLGSALKYCIRHNDKGNPLMDMQKAQNYINRIIESFELQNRAYHSLHENKALLSVFVSTNPFCKALYDGGLTGLKLAIDDEVRRLQLDGGVVNE